MRASQMCSVGLAIMLLSSLGAFVVMVQPVSASPDPPPTEFQGTTDDGYISVTGQATWDNARDATSGDVTDGGLSLIVMADGNGIDIFRSYLYFSTAGIPDNATIETAILSVYCFIQGGYNPWAFIVEGQPDYPHIPLASGDYNRVNYTEHNGSTPHWNSGGLVPYGTGWMNAELNATGISWINKTGITKLALMNWYDFMDQALGEGESSYAYYYSGEYGEYEPYLTITYLNVAPNSPTSLLCEDNTNPTRIIDFSPEFNAIGTDNNEDNMNYYALQVDNDSDFGSLIWDNTKTSITIFTNGSRCENITYTGSALSRGITYYWRIKFWDILDNEGAWSTESATFRINQIPTVSPAVTPTDPITTDNLICTPNGNDPDGDSMTYTYQWYENDILMSGQTDNILDNTLTATDNVYLCEVTPYDSYEYGSAENSNEVLIGNATPTKPTNWTNLGMNLIDHTPTITWTKGTDDDEDTVTTYVYVGTTSVPTEVENYTTGETADLGSIVTLTDGVTYYYRLRSWDGQVFSGYTTADQFRMNSLPTLPTGINNLGMNLIDHTPNKTFTKGTDADGDTVYTVAYLGTSGAPTEEDVRGTGTSLTLGENASHSSYPLANGQTYYVRLRSWDGYEWGTGYSADDNFRMNTPPTIPTSFTDLEENLYNHKPPITWTKGTDTENDNVWTYVYVGTTSTPTTVETSTTGSSAELGTTTPLVDNAAYYYRLRSWDGYEWSAYTTADGFSMAPKIVSPAAIILGLVICMTFAFGYLYFKVARVKDLVSGGEAIRGVFIFILAMIIMWAIAYGLITYI